jgi:hypothetical protein
MRPVEVAEQAKLAREVSAASEVAPGLEMAAALEEPEGVPEQRVGVRAAAREEPEGRAGMGARAVQREARAMRAAALAA